MVVLLEAPVSTLQVRSPLPSSPHGLAVITSRRALRALLADGAHLISIEPLAARGSLELLQPPLGAATVVGNLLTSLLTALSCFRQDSPEFLTGPAFPS
jgi:hypothetical protein